MRNVKLRCSFALQVAAVVVVIAIGGSLLPLAMAAVDDGDLRPLEELEPEEGWTLHTYVGLVLFILFLFIILISQLNKRVPAANSAFVRAASKFTVAEPARAKWWIMAALGAVAVAAYVYCHHICEKGGVPIFDCSIPFFHMLFRFSLSLFPYFIGACIVGGFIVKYFSSGHFKLPTSMIGACIFAAVIPVCSCGAVPLVRAMLATGQIRIRTIISFLMVAPVLSPFVIFFSFQLGSVYAITRILAIFALALVAGIVIERFVGVKEEAGGTNYFSCKGCAKASPHNPGASDSALLAGWDIMLFLLPYIVIGILIGAFIAKYVPASVVGTYLSSDITGLIIATSIGLPLFLCSGQEILILAPLRDTTLMGANALPVGHAIAFTIAGTGICISAIPALIPTIGKQATAIITVAFWLGAILLGVAINLLLTSLVFW
jgi:uncharacterized membrane protein YraQ (UPF0718 family)